LNANRVIESDDVIWIVDEKQLLPICKETGKIPLVENIEFRYASHCREHRNRKEH